ncbi:MAG: IS110 family transposase [Verrucomicrobiota bacterium]
MRTSIQKRLSPWRSGRTVPGFDGFATPSEHVAVAPVHLARLDCGLFTDLGCEVIVANSRKLRAFYQNDRKSDELDARMLAKLARADLHPIKHSSEQAQRDLLQIKLRYNLVRHRVVVISAVRFTLKALGIRLASPNTACFAKLARKHLEERDPELLAMIETSLHGVDEMTLQIRWLDCEIEQLCEDRYPETQRLRKIRGIGPITALCLVLVIEDPHRIDRMQDVGAYLGLVPKRDQSGKSDKELSISKCGNAYMRRLLVGAAQYMLGPFGEECDLKRRGLRLAERGGRGAKKKAVVATARKLSVVMLSVWKNESTYEPERNAA